MDITAQEIISSEENALKAVDALEDLFFRKIKSFGISDYEDTTDPRVTDVEKNFLFIAEQERGFQMSGAIMNEIDYVRDHANRWEAIGMSGTATAIRALASLKDLESQIYKNSLGEKVQSDLITQCIFLAREIEPVVRFDRGAEESLIKYVEENLDQFCKQDADGNFI